MVTVKISKYIYRNIILSQILIYSVIPFSYRSLVTATVIYDSESVVDVSKIQDWFTTSNSTSGIIMQRDAEAQVSCPSHRRIFGAPEGL